MLSFFTCVYLTKENHESQENKTTLYEKGLKTIINKQVRKKNYLPIIYFIPEKVCYFLYYNKYHLP